MVFQLRDRYVFYVKDRFQILLWKIHLWLLLQMHDYNSNNI